MREIYADVVVKVIGRRRFDMTNGWGGKPVAGEHVIVDTREPPSSLRTGRWCRPGLPPTAPPEASVAFWAELMDHESTTFEVQHVFTDGDWAAVRWRYRFGSTDAASVPDVKVTRVSGGRIIEQLGHTRTPGGLPLPE